MRASQIALVSDGRTGGSRTRGLMHPKHARFYLRHSPMVECTRIELVLSA